MGTKTGRMVRLYVAIVLSTVCGHVGSSIASDEISQAPGIPEAGFDARRLGGADVASEARIGDAVTFSGKVQLGVPVAVQGWAETKDGCFFDSGTWDLIKAPIHGSVSFRTVDGAPDACGNPLPYNTLFYTWTDASAHPATLDHVTAIWTSADGMFSGGGTFYFGYAPNCRKC
jgi:hypothetical protein